MKRREECGVVECQDALKVPGTGPSWNQTRIRTFLS